MTTGVVPTGKDNGEPLRELVEPPFAVSTVTREDTGWKAGPAI
ncbi:hypothetical protein [Chlorogloeopsis sp. ULAP02]